MTHRTKIWNSGGGVQSTAIAALIITGELPAPDLAVIADTERERSTTWEYMDRYVMPALDRAGVTLHRVKKSDFATVDLYGGKEGTTLLIPAFTDLNGEPGKLSTYCSNEWKREVVRRWATRVHGVTAATNWLGFSTDEVGRAARAMKRAKMEPKWQVDFPLIRLRKNRGDCIALVRRLGWPEPPRSSCWMCPNHRMNEWSDIRNHPADWQQVIQFDREMRLVDPNAYLTADCVPIEDADFNDAQEVMFGLDRGGCDSGQCFV